MESFYSDWASWRFVTEDHCQVTSLAFHTETLESCVYMGDGGKCIPIQLFATLGSEKTFLYSLLQYLNMVLSYAKQ